MLSFIIVCLIKTLSDTLNIIAVILPIALTSYINYRHFNVFDKYYS